MSQPISGQGSHLVFPIGPNKRPKGPHIVHLSTICHHFCLLIGPENTKLVEDVEILLPVKFRLNSVQQFERRSRKCLSQSEARVAILFF